MKELIGETLPTFKLDVEMVKQSRNGKTQMQTFSYGTEWGEGGGVMKEVKKTNKMMKDRSVMNYDLKDKSKNDYEKEKGWNIEDLDDKVKRK